MTLTDQIIHSFAKGSENYDREAYVQGVCAKHLGHFLQAQRMRLPPGPLLEIGCGTGFITKEIALCFPDRPFTATDICPTMLETCRSRINGDNLQFALLNGEVFCEEGRYALIASGLAFQWFRHFKESVGRLYNGLRRGGLLLFSILEAKSFPEWQEVCREQQIPYTGNDFPKLSDLRDIPATLTHAWEEKITLVYPSALECLKGFKRIGAGTSLKNKALTPSQMRQLLKAWDERSTRGVSITYNIANVAMQKW